MGRIGDINWTGQQRKAIFHADGDLFVSASAGTGKTEVLTARSAKLLAEPDKCPCALNILVVTFTEAAAGQMKARIHKMVSEMATARPQDRHLANQLLLIPAAQICTIHAFCYRLIQEHAAELGLDPGLRIIDQQGQLLLKTQALEQTLRWAWEQANLQAGLEALFRGRRIQTISDAISKIYQMLECLVDRDIWYDRILHAQQGILETDAAKAQIGWLVGDLSHMAEALHWLGRRLSQDKIDEDLIGLADLAGRLADLARSGQLGQLATDIRQISHLANSRSGGDTGLHLAVSMLLKGISGLADLAILDPDFVNKTSGDFKLQAQTLVRLVMAFEHSYQALKTKANGLDFADLERYALKLLSQPGPNGYKPSTIAMDLRARYRFILVDEYQDINPVQHTILSMLETEGNLFAVGDVKQCIYAFRGAEPAIFADCLRRAAAGSGPGRVDLTVNFRSVKGILDLANLLFGRLMRPEVSGVAYDQSAYLVPAQESACDEPAVELHIVDTNQTDDGQEDGSSLAALDRRRCQAALIADLVRRAVGADGQQSLLVRDPQTGNLRPARYGDIAVLLRSPAVSAREYQRAMHSRGIPVASTSAGLQDALEVQDCINLLKVIDNPTRDIELASVLRGPFFGISDSELVKIRIHSRGRDLRGGLYRAVLDYSRCGDDAGLAARLSGFIEALARWRHMAKVGDLSGLVWHVFLQTGLPWRVSALQDGELRRASLLRFHEQAIWFDNLTETAGGPALARLIEFLDALKGSETEVALPATGAQEDAVTIMSIHKAKGLEFPIVILAEMEAPFNLQDQYQDILVDPRYGLGMTIMDDHGRYKRPGLVHQVISRCIRDAAVAEEIRLFYVAVTRARDRLIMTGAMPRDTCRQVIELADLTCDGPIGSLMISGMAKRRGLANLLAWTIYACHDQPGLRQAFGLAQGSVKRLLEVQLHSPMATTCDAIRTAPPRATGQGLDGRLLSELRPALQWKYPNRLACSCRAKWSVTELVAKDRPVDLALDTNPSLTDSLDNLIGSATHLVLASLPLVRPVNRGLVQATLEDLVGQGRIDRGLTSAIDIDGIVRFFEGPIGAQALDPGNTVWREWPFTLAMRPSEILAEPYQDNDICVVEGVVDMVIQTPQGLVVVDFKTGRSQQTEGLYKSQVRLYARAAGAILGRPVVSAKLYYLADGRTVEVG